MVRRLLLSPPTLIVSFTILWSGVLCQHTWGQGAVPVVSAGGIVNNASYAITSSSVAPGTLAAIFGANLTDGSSCVPASGCFPSFDSEGRLATIMSGAQVIVNGNPVPIFYATPTQLGVQIPPDLPGTSATVRVNVEVPGAKAVSSAPYTLRLDPFSPGIFTLNQDGTGRAIATHSDGSLVTPSNPALPGEIVALFATGLGQVTPIVATGELPVETTTTLTTPTATVDGVPAIVVFSGLSGCCVGLNQINLMVPVSLSTGNDLPLVVNFSGFESNPVTIAVSANPLVFSPAFVDFGNVPIGAPATESVRITNRGTTGLSITDFVLLPVIEGSIVSAFSVSGLTPPRRLEPGQSITFSVNFSPAATGNVLARLSIHSDAIVGTAVPLSANGTFQPKVSTASLPGGRQGEPYRATLAATGGQTPYTWSITAGALPAGLTLAPNTGVISGTPTGSGTSTFTARVADANSKADTAPLSITVVPETLTSAFDIVTSSLQGARQNEPYSMALIAAGGQTPYTWSIREGTLPAGLALDPSGLISGTPTSSGTSNFTIRAVDANSLTATATLSLSVVQEVPLVISTGSLPEGTQGASYNATLAASGGQSPYSWSVTSGLLPASLTLSSSSGVIFGTPTGTGTSTFTVRVSDGNGQTNSKSFNLVVAQTNLPPVISTSSLAVGVQNWIYRIPVTVTNGRSPFSWSISSGTLPPGLTLSPSTGVISGTPTTIGTSLFTVRVTDTNSQSDATVLSLTIEPPPPAIITLSWTASTSTVVGYNAYRGEASGGPYTKLNSELISNTSFIDITIPRAATTYYYVVTAVNDLGYESAFSNEALAIVP